MGHLVAPRRRRHLAAPRRADRPAVPAGHPRRRPAPRREAVPRPGCSCCRPALMGSFLSLDLFVFFIFFEIVLVPMYFLIGGWGYDNRQYAALKFFLFTMFGSAFMLVGIVATAFLAARPRRGRADVRPRRARRPGRVPGGHRTLAVLRLRHRLRRQGADLPAAHVAARRPHPGADGGLGDPRRGDAQARDLRPAALRAVPLPRGGAVEPPAVPHARRRRRASTGRSWRRCRRTSSGSSPTRRSPTSGSSSSASSPSPASR